MTTAPRAKPHDDTGWLDLWLGPVARFAIETGRFRRGLNSIEVRAASPCAVDLHLVFADAGRAPLLVPLERHGQARYRATALLDAPVGRAELAVRPAEAAGGLAIHVAGPDWRRLGAIAWRAARRHAGNGRLLIGKARQVLRGGSNLVFSSEGPQAELPESESYATWRQAFESPAADARIEAAWRAHAGNRDARLLAILPPWRHGPEALDELLASLAAQAGCRTVLLDLRSGVEWRPEMRARLAGFERIEHPGSLAPAIAAARADAAIVLETPGRFPASAARSFALALARAPKALAVYADHDRLGADGERHAPVFKPAWSPDYELATGYIGPSVAFRADRAALAAILDAEPRHDIASRLLARLAAEEGETAVAHIPRVLFHARDTADPGRMARRLEAVRAALEPTAEITTDRGGTLRVRRAPSTASLHVSAIIPTKDSPDLLARAVASVRAARGVTADLVIVDNGAETAAQKALLGKLAGEPATAVLEAHEPFNFSRLINRGRQASRGEILLLLNDDVEALDATWLAAMAAEAARPEIGAVGALLLYPDGRVQHAGVLVGINGGAGHACRFADGESEGPGHRLVAPREVAAVTAACLAVRASVFDEVGGFAEDLPVTLNDVDFCLKVRARGYRCLFTPRARLIHRESATRGLDATPAKLERLSSETAAFRRTWGEAAVSDPYLGPHASRAHEDFRMRRL